MYQLDAVLYIFNGFRMSGQYKWVIIELPNTYKTSSQHNDINLCFARAIVNHYKYWTKKVKDHDFQPKFAGQI